MFCLKVYITNLPYIRKIYHKIYLVTSITTYAEYDNNTIRFSIKIYDIGTLWLAQTLPTIIRTLRWFPLASSCTECSACPPTLSNVGRIIPFDTTPHKSLPGRCAQRYWGSC